LQHQRRDAAQLPGGRAGSGGGVEETGGEIRRVAAGAQEAGAEIDGPSVGGELRREDRGQVRG
jgi:hypothetical protein